MRLKMMFESYCILINKVIDENCFFYSIFFFMHISITNVSSYDTTGYLFSFHYLINRQNNQ